MFSLDKVSVCFWLHQKLFVMIIHASSIDSMNSHQSGRVTFTSELVIGPMAAHDRLHRLLGTHFDPRVIERWPLRPMSALLCSDICGVSDPSRSLQEVSVLHIPQSGKTEVLEICETKKKMKYWIFFLIFFYRNQKKWNLSNHWTSEHFVIPHFGRLLGCLL